MRFNETFEDPRDASVAVVFDKVPIVNPSSNTGLTKRIAGLVGSDYHDVVACLSVAWLRPGPEVRVRAMPFLYAFRSASATVGIHMRTGDTTMIREQCYLPNSHGCSSTRRRLKLDFHNRPGCVASDDQLVGALVRTVLPSCLAEEAHDVAVFIAADHALDGPGTPWFGPGKLANATVLATAGRPHHTGRSSPLASHAEAELKAVLDFLLLTETMIYVSNCDLRCNFWTHQGKCGNTYASNVVLRRSAPKLALTNLFAPLATGNFTCPVPIAVSSATAGLSLARAS